MKKYIIAALDQLSNNIAVLIILCVEFVVMISCFSLCFGALKLYEIRQKMYADNNMQDFYYVKGEEPEETNKWLNDELGLDVMSFGYCKGTDNFTDIMLYSRSALENIEILTSKGENIDPDKNYNGAVPCVITSELAKKYEVGKTYELKTDHDIRIGKFYICGVIKNDVIFSPNYGFDYDTTCIIAYNPENKVKKDPNYVEFYAVDTSPIKDFDEKYSEYISENIFQPFVYYYKERNILERDLIMPYIVLAITFLALSAAGLLSYTVLSLEYSKRLVGVQYLCGAKLRQLIFVFIIKNIMIVTVPAILSIPVISSMKNSELSETTLISWQGYLIAVGMCFAGLIISSLIMHLRINRRQIIKTLKSV